MEIEFLEKYKKNVISDTLNTIYKAFTIIDQNKEIVELETLKNHLKKDIERCIGITTGTHKQCSRNAQLNSKYCKLHHTKYTSPKKEIKKYKIDYISDDNDERNYESDTSNNYNVYESDDDDNENEDDNSDNSDNSDNESENVRDNIKKHVEKKFIDDKLYYIDDKYVYDLDNLKKVGYKETNKYIITSDPFVLRSLRSVPLH